MRAQFPTHKLVFIKEEWSRVMTAVLMLLENLTNATQSVTLHFFFAILLIDRSNDWWSRHKY